MNSGFSYEVLTPNGQRRAATGLNDLVALIAELRIQFGNRAEFRIKAVRKAQR
jgi:hypothetical protein